MKRHLYKAILFYFTFIASLYAIGEKKYAPIAGFTGGLNSAYSSLNIAENEVQEALNVWFDEDSSVVKRNGFTVYGSSTSDRYTNGWSYTDSSNNNWIITLSSNCIRASKGDGVFTVIVATVPAPVVSLVDAVSAFGNIYFVDSSQGVYYWDGTNTTYIGGSPKGSLICEFQGRLWVAGEAHPNQNRLSASEHLDPTNWTSGSLATDPITFIVGLTDKSDGITKLYSGLNDAIYIFKRNSIHALYGFSQDDFQVRVLTSEAGCIQGNTVQPFAGGILFLSKRGFEIFDGVSPRIISKKINNQITTTLNSSFSQKSWTQDSGDDWNQGSISPPGTLSTTTVPGDIITVSSLPVVIIATNTTTADFSASSYYSYVAFDNDELKLDYAAASSRQTACCNTNLNNYSCTGNYLAQQFVADEDYLLTQVSVYCADISWTGNWNVKILSDSSNTPGSELGRGTFSFCNDGSAAGDYTPTNITVSSVAVTNGSKYWVQLIPAAGTSCNASNRVVWYKTNTAATATFPRYNVDSTVYTDHWFNTGLSGKTRETYGSFQSLIADSTTATKGWQFSYDVFNANAVLNGGTLTYYTATCNSKVDCESGGTVWTQVIPGSSINSYPYRYIGYKVILTGPGTLATPIVYDTHISVGNRKRSPMLFTSPIHNTGSSINSFGSLVTLEDLNDGFIYYNVCTSSSSDMITSICAIQSGNSQILAPINAYVQVTSSFNVTVGTQNPTIHSYSVEWNEGNRGNSPTSAIYKDKYWVSLTTNSLNSGNDCTFVMSYNLNRDGLIWSKHDINAGAYIVYKDELYHADSNSTGNVYKDYQGFNDNGAAINGYFITKDYALDSILSEKWFDGLYLISDALGNYNLNTSYYIDRYKTNEFALGTVVTNEQSGLIDIKLPFPIDSTHQTFGKTITFKFGNSVLDSPMRVYGGSLSYFLRKPL